MTYSSDTHGSRDDQASEHISPLKLRWNVPIHNQKHTQPWHGTSTNKLWNLREMAFRTALAGALLHLIITYLRGSRHNTPVTNIWWCIPPEDAHLWLQRAADFGSSAQSIILLVIAVPPKLLPHRKTIHVYIRYKSRHFQVVIVCIIAPCAEINECFNLNFHEKISPS